MKQTLLLVVWAFFFTCAFSQTDIISISPNPAEGFFSVDISDPYLDLEVHAEVKNLTEDTLRLKWERFEMDRPEAWQSQVCDNNFCYLPNVSTNYEPNLSIEEPVILPPDSAFTLIFHCLLYTSDAADD